MISTYSLLSLSLSSLHSSISIGLVGFENQVFQKNPKIGKSKKMKDTYGSVLQRHQRKRKRNTRKRYEDEEEENEKNENLKGTSTHLYFVVVDST